MAKIEGPLLSMGASGSMGPRLTFSQRKSGQQVRFQRAQTDIVTSARATQRDYFKSAAGWWSEMTTAEKSGFGGYDDKEA